MFAAQAVSVPALRPRRDRRECVRFVHSGPVQVNGQLGAGRDISAKGLAVLSPASVDVGEIVRIAIPDEISAHMTPSRARVARIESRSGGRMIGLEFVD
jgi:hypothetical protein